jgi:hypothetical protein
MIDSGGGGAGKLILENMEKDGLINFPGLTMDGYRKDLRKLGGLGVEGLYPGHMLLTVKNWQKHIDTAIAQCTKSCIPRSIGQFEFVF